MRKRLRERELAGQLPLLDSDDRELLPWSPNTGAASVTGPAPNRRFPESVVDFIDIATGTRTIADLENGA